MTAVIASYNRARFLSTAIESVLAQSARDVIELVVVDDGSSDDSLAVATAFHYRYPQLVSVFTHPSRRNRGISATCNLALSHATGTFLAWLGDDDAWYPHKTARQLRSFDDHSAVALCYGMADVVDSHGSKTGAQIGAPLDEGDPLADLLHGNSVPATSVMVPRSRLAGSEPFSVGVLYSDWELWATIMSRGDALFLSEALAQYRRHASNATARATAQDEARRRAAVYVSLRGRSDSVGGRLCTPRYRALLDLELAFALDESGDIAGAKKAMQRAINSGGFFTDLVDVRAWLFRRDPTGKFGVMLARCIPSGIRYRRILLSEALTRLAFSLRSSAPTVARGAALRSMVIRPHQRDWRSLLLIALEATIGRRCAGFLRTPRRSARCPDPK